MDAAYGNAYPRAHARAPLGPKKTAPLYIFSVGNGYVGVNTKTGKVKPLT